MAQVLLVPDAARGADGKGRFVDLAWFLRTRVSMRITVPSSSCLRVLSSRRPKSVILRLGGNRGLPCIVRSRGGHGPVPCLSNHLTGPSLLLARLLVALGRCRGFQIRLLLLVQLLELAPVETQQNVGKVLAGFGPEIRQVGAQHRAGDRVAVPKALDYRRRGAGPASPAATRRRSPEDVAAHSAKTCSARSTGGTAAGLGPPP